VRGNKKRPARGIKVCVTYAATFCTLIADERRSNFILVAVILVDGRIMGPAHFRLQLEFITMVIRKIACSMQFY
jgi:hypothetical protein